MMHRRTAIIFRDHLLGPSETFVLAQGESLGRYTALYVGSRLVDGLDVPPDRLVVLNRRKHVGKILEVPFKMFGYTRQFASRLTQSEPALIHAHFGTGGAMALPLARRLNIPLVVTFHGIDATLKAEYRRRSNRGQRLLMRRWDRLRSESDQIIAVSHFIKSKLIERGYSGDQIVVHYIGIDTSLFQPDDSISRDPVVLFVGRLVEKKGCEYLIRAMAAVQQVRPDVQLVIIGDGPLRRQLEMLANKQLKRVRFLGTLGQADIASWMNRSRVFCVPSVSAHSGDAEGLGMVFLEAQSMGLPVVSFASGGIPEAVAHGSTGLLAPERDVDTLTKYLMALLADEAQWQAFAFAGRERVRRQFDLRTQSCKLEALYDNVVEKFAIR